MSASDAVELPAEISDRGDGSLFFGGGGEYWLWGKVRDGFALEANYLGLWQLKLEEFHLQSLGGSARLEKRIAGQWLVQARVGYGYWFLGGQSF